MAEILEEPIETEEAEEYAPGELAETIVTPSKVWKPGDFQDATTVGVITSLVKSVSNADEAARRFQVLQTWEMRHMDRGYQYLDGDGNGGWRISGTNTTARNNNSLAAMDDAGLYPTNILSAQGDIAVGALMRGKITASFFPADSKNPADAAAADEADKYKRIWAKNNSQLQRDVLSTFWTDCRVLNWTRTVAGKRFGSDKDGNPAKCEITTAHGVLESKLPMMFDHLSGCSYAQIWEERDYAEARAAYPWMGNKIKPSWGTYGELEFERIARINTRIGIIGKYITGTSGLRETTMGYIWLRPGMFFNDDVPASAKEFFLSNFPSGLFVVMAGPEFCCCWDECMDQHLSLGLSTRGFGQNRRSLGSSDLPIQKRINIWADLWDKFVRSAIPITLLENKAFNAEAVSDLEAAPSRFLSVALEEGQTMAEVVGQTPSPVPIPGMNQMLQWYVGPLIQSIDGAAPALFGGAEGADNTVGATQIRLNQSLERYGTPWQVANRMFAESCLQAALLCAKNQTDSITSTINGEDVRVNPSRMAGNLICEPDTSGAVPESGAQREAKVLQILDMAQANQQVASIVATPSNAREIVRALHIQDIITVDEADSEDKQLEEIALLLESEPILNPKWEEINQAVAEANAQHEQAKASALEAASQGVAPGPDEITNGEQLEQELVALQAELQATPRFLPSVPVAQDESEDHTTEADTLFSWMQTPAGRAARRESYTAAQGSPEWGRWMNCYLHWQGHKQMAAKIAAESPAKVPVKASISIPADKITGPEQAKILQAAGISAVPQPEAPHEVEQETRVYGPQAEVTTKTKRKL